MQCAPPYLASAAAEGILAHLSTVVIKCWLSRGVEGLDPAVLPIIRAPPVGVVALNQLIGRIGFGGAPLGLKDEAVAW